MTMNPTAAAGHKLADAMPAPANWLKQIALAAIATLGKRQKTGRRSSFDPRRKHAMLEARKREVNALLLIRHGM